MNAITYLWHGSLFIETWWKKLLVDPYITPNPLAKNIDIDEIICDYILITHAHGDHIADVKSIATRTGATIISNAEIAKHYAEKWLQSHSMNHGGKYEFDFGTLKYVNAIHTSSFPDGSNGGNPGGFVIWNNTISIYIAGDTALTQDMKLIPLTCPKLDLAVLPIGDNFTMWYEDAAIASDFIQCQKVLWYHYDTFPPIKIDKQEVLKYFKEKQKELLLPNIGTTLNI